MSCVPVATHSVNTSVTALCFVITAIHQLNGAHTCFDLPYFATVGAPALSAAVQTIIGAHPVPPAKFYPAPRPATPIPQAMPPLPPKVAPAPASMPAPEVIVPQAPKLSKSSREEVASQHASIVRVLSRCLRAPIAKMCSSDLHLQQKNLVCIHL